MNESKLETLLRYGVSSDLAERASSENLSAAKVRSLSQKDMASKFGFTALEARELSRCVKRQAIKEHVVQNLLERSNFVCSICKGQKSPTYVIHHIVEYEKTQNNDYDNLVVLCPADHDLAHGSGLTLTLSVRQLRITKRKWEKQVEIENVQRASRQVVVDTDTIDYVNVKRIEELCVKLFKKIPITTHTSDLRKASILRANGSFDQKYVQTHLSGGRYLFDYISHQEPEHYKQLLQKIAKKVDFADLDEAAKTGYSGLKKIEGCYAHFIGGVCANGPGTPITSTTPNILLHYKRKNLRVEWILDPLFMMSMSAIGRIGGKNRYIIYCRIGTVRQRADQSTLVCASPFLIAQPTKWIDKTPRIAVRRRYTEEFQEDILDSKEDDV
jgi:HNH endonuclease